MKYTSKIKNKKDKESKIKKYYKDKEPKVKKN